MATYVGAIDQGTTCYALHRFRSRRRDRLHGAKGASSRFIRKPGFVEHDPAGDLEQYRSRHRRGFEKQGLAPRISPPSASPISARRR